MNERSIHPILLFNAGSDLVAKIYLFGNKIFDSIQIGLIYITVFIRPSFLISCQVKIKLISPFFFAFLFVTQFCNSKRAGIM